MSWKVYSLFQWSGIAFAFIILAGCGKPGPAGLFKKRSPHQLYTQRLKDAGFDRTAMGRAWLKSADSSLQKPISISIPYKETGYFAAEKAPASAFRFQAREGEKVTVTLSKNPAADFTIFIDLFNGMVEGQPEMLAFADTSESTLTYDVDNSGSLILRLQPELLRSGEYTMTITNGPSMAYPIKAPGANHIKSFWGDGRDAGSRMHEGIDLFAPFRTPVVAAAEGVISRVNENRLGGKVVWLRPSGSDYRLYYAHLDTQLVRDGDLVNVGDTLGLMGNTGNARTTPPHLHFGIYSFAGAVDPLPFVKQHTKQPEAVSSSLVNLNAVVRTIKGRTPLFSSPDRKSVLLNLQGQSTLSVEAASGRMYRAALPDGQTGYLSSSSVQAAAAPIRHYRLSTEQSLIDRPMASAARKATLPSGTEVSILGNCGNYHYVSDGRGEKGWIRK